MFGHSIKRLSWCFILMMALMVFGGTVSFGQEKVLYLDETLGGFTRAEEVRFYDGSNLYEYIDGQAVFYISYGFKRLEHGVYKKADKQYTVDVYELNSRLSAFGAYRQQRDPDADKLDAGAEGSILDYLTVFYKGPFYIEIIPVDSDSEDMETMRALAKAVAAKIPGETDAPPEVSLFPQEGLIAGSERYVDENLLSYAVMGRGLTALYDQGGDSELRVFLALPDNNEEALKVYNGFNEKIKNGTLAKLEEAQGIKGDTPYRGMAVMYIRDKYVFGCLSVKNEDAATGVLSKLYGTLKKKGLVQ